MADSLLAFGLGVGTRDADGNWLEIYYPHVVFDPSAERAALIAEHFGDEAREYEPEPKALTAYADAIRSADAPAATVVSTIATAGAEVIAVLLGEDRALASTAEAYLKLHLLSLRHVKPNEINLEGIYEVLPTVAWTSDGPIALEALPRRLVEARLDGRHLEVNAIDKFPPMLNYVVPSGVRVAVASRVRLGAYLGEGTTVMHEGFVNFNAGAVGPNMVEGRISQGVVLGEGTDLGGSASTMGTLSGGGSIVISLGKNCLVGANAGTGIPLGDRCTIEAGLYITASTPVTVLDEAGNAVKTVKGRELAGQSDLLFIRNGLTGTVECRTNRSAIALNEALHAHN
ncbi:MAG: DapH/DapD/GlmU-related protein [Gammaproteobacteria bacterium]|jgi:2,3,4,5-tetrahydropyridine-2-carboxylate N-succinyltransferase